MPPSAKAARVGDAPVVRAAAAAPREDAPSGLRTYLATLFEHSLSGEAFDEDVEVEVRPIRAGRPLHSYRAAKDIPGVIKLVRGAVGAGADVYNGVHLRRRGTERSGDHAVSVLTAIICDIDCAKGGVTREAAIAAVDHSPFGPPTMSVWSGGGVHGYWIYNERVEATTEAVRTHRMGCAYLRAWLQAELGRGLTAESAKRIVDDMSTPDRILRSPGSRNMKPARAAANGGVAPAVEIIAVRESKWIDLADVPDIVPPGFNPDAFATRASRARADGSTDALPTAVPERIRRVLAQAKIPFRVATASEYVTAIKLLPCPACGQADGGCYLTPKAGSLRTYHASSCPASTYPAGIPLDEWVYRYARDATPSLDAPAPPAPSQIDRGTRLALAIANFGASPSPAAVSGLSDRALAGLLLADVAYISHDQAEGAPPRGPGALPRELAKLAGEGGALLAPLRDATGEVRQGLWIATGDTLPPRLAPSRGDDVVAGGLLVLGHLPSAAKRAGEGAALFLAHGPADYLAALAIVAELGEPASVIGIAADPRRVIDHLAATWTAAGVRPKRVVALTGPTLNDDALKHLDGVAGLVVVDSGSPGGINAAILAGASVDGIKRRIRSEPARFRAPISIMDAGRHVEADIRSAVTFAANTSTADRQTLVVYVIPPGGGKTTAAQSVASDVATGALAVPVVGKKPPSVPDHQWPPAGRAVGFALPNHALADEKHRDHIERGIAAHPDRFQSALRDCHFADRVRPAYRFVGRRGICGDPGKPNRCEHADQGCPGAVAPKAQRGAVAYVAHAMVRYLKLDFAFIDEDSGVIDEATVSDAEIATLHLGYPIPRVKRWRSTDNPEAVAAAEMLRDLFGPLARKHGDDVAHGRVAPFSRRVCGDELCRLLETQPKLVQLIGIGFGKDAQKPPQPWPNELRSGPDIHNHVPHGGAWLALVELLAMYRRLREKPNPNALPMLEVKRSPPPMVDLVLTRDGTWALSTRTVKPLPDCPVVLLDATGELTLAEYEAAYPHFRVVMRGTKLWGAAPKPAIHVRTKGTSRAALFLPTGHIRPSAPTVVRNIILRMVAEVRTRRPGPRERRLAVGVLTYKGIYDCITGASMGGGVLASIRAELAAAGVDLLAGYYGRDDRGTNAFERVDGLAVIGDARQNLGEVEADCALLGLDASDVFNARSEAVLVQALFRARHTRRAPGDEAVVLLAAAGRPHVPGVAWTEESMPRSTVGGEAYDVVAFVAGELGVIGDEPIRAFSWVVYDQPAPKLSSRARAEAVQRVLQGRPDWLPYRVTLAAHGGAPCQVWGASLEAVEAWAYDVAGSRRVEPGRIASNG